MKKPTVNLHGFLPLLSITAVIVKFVLYLTNDTDSLLGDEMVEEGIAVCIISVSMMCLCFFYPSYKNKNMYITCSMINFVFSMRLVVSSAMGLMIGELSLNNTICLAFCTLTMVWFTASVSGACIVRKSTIHPSVHVMAILHMILMIALSVVLYKPCLEFSVCLPLVISIFIREHNYNKKEAVQNEA